MSVLNENRLRLGFHFKVQAEFIKDNSVFGIVKLQSPQASCQLR